MPETETETETVYVTEQEYKKSAQWLQQQLKRNNFEVPKHLRFATKLTREGKMDPTNKKRNHRRST